MNINKKKEFPKSITIFISFPKFLRPIFPYAIDFMH